MKIATNISNLADKAKPSQHDQLLDQSRKWVAQTFYGTLLKQMRNSPFHSDLFDGGRGGQAFGQLLDQTMVDHLAKGSGDKLAKSIVKRIEARQARQEAAKAQAGGTHVSTIV